MRFNRDLLIALVILMSGPALADDMALHAFSWLMTGGPFALYFAALWGAKHSKRLRAQDQEFAKMFTVIATFIGYGFAAKHFCDVAFSTNAIRSGVGILMGPTFLLGGAIGGRIPSLIYQSVYRLRGIKVDSEERIEDSVKNVPEAP